MKKFVLLYVLMIIAVNSYGQVKTKETFEKEKQEEISKRNYINIAILLFLLDVIGVGITCHYCMRKKPRKNMDKELETLSNKAYLITQNLLSIKENIKEAKKAHLPEAGELEAIYLNFTSDRYVIMNDSVGILQLKKLIEDYNKIEDAIIKVSEKIKSAFSNIVFVKNYLLQIDSADAYFKLYREYASEPYKPLFADDETIESMPAIMEDYKTAIIDHMVLREQLQTFLNEGKTIQAKLKTEEISVNIKDIARFQSSLEKIKADDEEKKYYGAYAKDMIMYKCDYLLSFCDEPSCPEDIRASSKLGIAQVKKAAAAFTTTNVKRNYVIYVNLVKRLEACSRPHKYSFERIAKERTNA